VPGTWILQVRKPPYYAGLSYPRVPPRITPETFVEAEAHGKTAYTAFMLSLKCYQRMPVIEPRELWVIICVHKSLIVFVSTNVCDLV